MDRIEINLSSGQRSTVALTAEDVAALQAYAASPAGVAQRVAEYERAVDAHVRAQARALGYNSTESCASYATSTHVKFGPEARAFVDWRDQVWDTCATLLAGNTDPGSAHALIALLPTFTPPGA